MKLTLWEPWPEVLYMLTCKCKLVHIRQTKRDSLGLNWLQLGTRTPWVFANTQTYAQNHWLPQHLLRLLGSLRSHCDTPRFLLPLPHHLSPTHYSLIASDCTQCHFSPLRTHLHTLTCTLSHAQSINHYSYSKCSFSSTLLSYHWGNWLWSCSIFVLSTPHYLQCVCMSLIFAA